MDISLGPGLNARPKAVPKSETHIIRRRYLPDKMLADDRDFLRSHNHQLRHRLSNTVRSRVRTHLHDVLPDLGNIREEEQGEYAGDGAETACCVSAAQSQDHQPAALFDFAIRCTLVQQQESLKFRGMG